MGKCWFGVVLIVLGFATLLQGYPTEDLVLRLPGQPKVKFNQYAGYVDIDLKHGKSFFYYFVEADHEPHKKPLTLWLNGGPGCSSIGGGAFTELGPFYPNGDGRTLRKNSHSWNKESNLLFVESPAGVGWSYSNRTADYNTGDISTTNDMLVFMLNWYEKFPSYKSKELFLTGESYAGHYIPQLANVILDYNVHSSSFKFNVKGIAIGNPLLKLNHDFRTRTEYLWSHGVISDESYHDIITNCNFENETFPNLHVPTSCKKAANETSASIGNYTDIYDVILDVCNPSLVEQELRLKKMITQISLDVDVCIGFEMGSYLNRPEVQKALHANHTNLPYEWSMCSQVLNYSQADTYISMLPVLKRIVQNNIPIWVFSGDQDSVIPFIGSRTHIRNIAHDLKFNITVPYRTWFNKDQVGGWVTEYGNLLTFATVRGASHMVPYAQPSRALQLFSSFVNGKRLPNTTKPIDE